MKAKILSNTRKKWASKLAREVRTHLRKRGFDLVKKGASVTVVIGGDGTLLYYGFRNMLEGYIVGIGSRSSKVCQLERDHWAKEIDDMLKVRKSEERFMLDIEINRKKYRAINDVVLHTTNYRVIDIIVNIGRKKHFFRGDGIIVSTATGSSGYAYSAGAELLEPKSDGMVLAPICPYLRQFSAVVVGKTNKIKMSSKNTAAIIIDGMFIKNIKEKTIRVKQGETWHYLLKR